MSSSPKLTCRIQAYATLKLRLACLVVGGEGVEKFFLRAEVFHELRGQFHEIPIDICTRKGTVGGVGEDAVKGMPKLMQEGFHLAQCEQGWLLVCRF